MAITRVVPGWYQRINTSNGERTETMTYKAFCLANEPRLKTLYPFLPQKQIKGKLFKQWKTSQLSEKRLKTKPKSEKIKSRRKHSVVLSAPTINRYKNLHQTHNPNLALNQKIIGSSFDFFTDKQLQSILKTPGQENRPSIFTAQVPDVVVQMENLEKSVIEKESTAASNYRSTSLKNKVSFSITKSNKSPNPNDRHLISTKNTQELPPAVVSTSHKQKPKLQTNINQRAERLKVEAASYTLSPEFCSVLSGNLKDREKSFCLFEDEFPVEELSPSRKKSKRKTDTQMVVSSNKSSGSGRKCIRTVKHSTKKKMQIRGKNKNSDQKSKSQLKRHSVSSFPTTMLKRPSEMPAKDLGIDGSSNAQTKTCLKSSYKKLSKFRCQDMLYLQGSIPSPPLFSVSLDRSKDQGMTNKNGDEERPEYEMFVGSKEAKLDENYMSLNWLDSNKEKTRKSASVIALNSKQLCFSKQAIRCFDNILPSGTRCIDKSKKSHVRSNTSNKNSITSEENKDSRNKTEDRIRCQLLSEITDACIIPSGKNENTQSPPFPSGSQKKTEDLIGPSELSNKELETGRSSILLKIINQLKPCKTSCQSLVQPEPFEAKTVEKRPAIRPSKRDNILCNMFEEPQTRIQSRRYISSKEYAQFPVLDDGDFM